MIPIPGQVKDIIEVLTQGLDSARIGWDGADFNSNKQRCYVFSETIWPLPAPVITLDGKQLSTKSRFVT